MSLSPCSCSLQRRPPLGCPRMDTSFKKWVSLTLASTLQRSGRCILNLRKDPLRVLILKPPVIRRWSCGTEEAPPPLQPHAAPQVQINNELSSSCHDNGTSITVKPGRGAQLACAAQASGTPQASIGSPRLPRLIIPPLQPTHALSRFTDGPPGCTLVFIRPPLTR